MAIVDGDPTTFRVTMDKTKAERDWYQVTVDEPVEARRIALYHGRVSHDGGWFDTSNGKPEVFVRKAKDGPWEQIGKLDSYPDTTNDRKPDIPDGQAFELTISPTKLCGVRIEGRPAWGDDPKQTFSSCTEIAAHDH